jgi:pyridoxal phosphate enzyme (YggS family)
MSVAQRLAAVRDEIARAAEAAGRSPSDVTLVAVSKTHPAEAIEEAIAAGQRVFGENRVQEAMAKWPAIRERHPDVTVHMIGHLQTNKVEEAVATFDVIETVDRLKLSRRLAAEMARTGRRLPCFVEVNTGEEPQKGGVAPAEAEAFVRRCIDEDGLEIVGLMCIPPVDQEPSPHFALLAELARRAGLAGLSMGMSADYEVAIGLGATHVRVGTAIFGPRRVG